MLDVARGSSNSSPSTAGKRVKRALPSSNIALLKHQHRHHIVSIVDSRRTYVSLTYLFLRNNVDRSQISGPMYGGPLHNPAFIERILRYLPNLDKETYPTMDRIEGMLMTALEETDLYVEENSKNEKSTPGESEISRVDPSMIDHHPFYFIP